MVPVFGLQFSSSTFSPIPVLYYPISNPVCLAFPATAWHFSMARWEQVFTAQSWTSSPSFSFRDFSQLLFHLSSASFRCTQLVPRCGITTSICGWPGSEVITYASWSLLPVQSRVLRCADLGIQTQCRTATGSPISSSLNSFPIYNYCYSISQFIRLLQSSSAGVLNGLLFVHGLISPWFITNFTNRKTFDYFPASG